MGIMDTEKIYEGLGISREVWEYGQRTESRLKERFEEFDKNAEYNQMKVIRAMQENRVSEGCFNYVSGYGYNDLGRDTLESVYASVFHTEAALVRPQITCGTHALALAANLRPGDELLSPVGKPYDTLEEVIGIRPSKGSLAEYGITYRQVELLEDGYFDYPAIEAALNEKIKLVTIQRSKGYQTRPSYSVEKIGELIAFIKERRPDVICMVDNCYGEFVERCRSRYDRRFSDQKSGRRPCTDRWIYCRTGRSDRELCLPADFSGTGKRSGGISRSHAVILSGIFPCTDCGMRCVERGSLCSQYL